ncbi:MAG: DUF58 domain-containing protein [Oscillospiraceae bacterium]|nr:DUF58 domain-containing protein [Oscillospiraceae bacterium]
MKILYIFILLIVLLFSVLYLGDFSVLLLLILLVLPVFLWLSIIYIKLCIDISLKSNNDSLKRNNPRKIQLIVDNNGFLPVGKAVACVICSNIMTGEKAPVYLIFPIPARNTTTIEFTITIPHCGITEISLQNLIYTDYIRLFKKKIKSNSSVSVLTLPSGKVLNYKINIPYSKSDDEGSIYSRIRSGDDPSEVYRIREYQPGDVQKRIHWKLSCRTDTVWVKEYSLPIRKKAAILIDYSFSGNYSADVIDTVLETAYTLSSALIKQEIPAAIYWFSSKTNKIVWNEIHSVSELNDCFAAILSNIPVNSSRQFIVQAADLIELHSNNAIYYCTPDYCNENIQKLNNIFRKNCIYILTADFEKRNLSGNNIVYVNEDSIEDNLKKLSEAEVKYE